MLTVRLPWPPSTNRLTRCIQNRAISSREARAWRERASTVLASIPHPRGYAGDVAVRLEIEPYTFRRFDLDNRLKACLDLLQACGVIEDDDQVQELHAYKLPVGDGPKAEGGSVLLTVESLK